MSVKIWLRVMLTCLVVGPLVVVLEWGNGMILELEWLSVVTGGLFLLVVLVFFVSALMEIWT